MWETKIYYVNIFTKVLLLIPVTAAVYGKWAKSIPLQLSTLLDWLGTHGLFVLTIFTLLTLILTFTLAKQYGYILDYHDLPNSVRPLFLSPTLAYPCVFRHFVYFYPHLIWLPLIVYLVVKFFFDYIIPSRLVYLFETWTIVLTEFLCFSFIVFLILKFLV